MDDTAITAILEALLFVAGEPLSIDRMKEILEGVDRGKIKSSLYKLQEEYKLRDSGLTIVEVAGGFQIVTRLEVGEYVKKLRKIKYATRLSKPSLETLAIIAYKQPIVKTEIEEIRGVDSTGVIKGLLNKRLIRIVGRKDEPGRPILYGTTKEFLHYFGLRDLSDLPTLKELEALVEEKDTEILQEDISGMESGGS